MKKLLKKLLILTVCAATVIAAMPLTGTIVKDLLSHKALAYDDFYEEDYYENDYFEYGEYECRIEEEGKISIMKYKGGAAEIVIPSEINGYTVGYIGEYAFSPMAETESGDEVIKYPDCNNLVSVTVPSTVIEIGYRAFFYCQNLENVILSEGLEYIGTTAFAECIKLRTVELPSTLVQFDTSAFFGTAIEDLVIKENPNGYYFVLSNGCFYGSSIKKVVVKGEAYVSSSVFENSSVEEIVFEGKVRSFSKNAVSKENNPVKRIIFKADFPSGTIENLTTTSGYYYHKNSKDGSVRFDTISYNSDYAEIFTLEGFGEYAINENSEAVILKYTGKSSQITVPDEIDGHTVVEISDYAFYNYSTVDIRKIVGPSTVKKIGAFAFAGNGLLNEVEFSGAEEIGYATFKDCSWLDTVKLMFDSIKVIEPYTFYNCDIEEISLPSVEIIGEKAFMGCYMVRTITLSDYMTDIGEYAFSECRFLKITIPEGIKIIRERTFSDCRNLSTIVLPTTIEEIEAYAFVNCDKPTIENTKYITKLNSYSFYASKISSFEYNPEIKEIPAYCFYSAEFNELVVPSTIEKVGKYAYATACTPTTSDINHIVISEGVKEIGEHSFEDNGQYTLTLPSTLEEIPIRAFKGATISNLVIPEGVKYIREDAFAIAKIDTLTIPESLKTGYGAFDSATVNTLYLNAINCSSLETRYMKNLYIGDKVEVIPGGLCTDSSFTEIVIPEGVKEIKSTAFDGNYRLTSVTLPSTLQTIGSYAFRDCTGLKEFTITEGVTKFYEKVFYGCKALETIYFNSTNCNFKNLTKGTDGIYQSPFYDNRNTLKKIVIGDNVKTVPAYLLSYMPNEVECVMSDSVENIGDYAFYSCPKLTEFNAPKNLKNIGYYAFAKSGLVTFNGNGNLESIGKGCFEGCKNLVNINLGGEPKVIVASVSEDENTEAVNPVSNLMLIGANAFANCTSLTEIIIPDSVKDIGEKAFYGDKALVSVKMSDNVIFIPDECFNGCTALETFMWNAESKLIGRLAFSKCAKLADFDFVNIEKLYDNSFLNSGVADVQLGEAKDDEVAKLTVVESQSFMDCDSLTSVGVGGNVTTIKTQAFANCENLETVYIADSVTEIAADAFDGCENMMIYCSVDSYAYTYAQTQGLSVSTLVIAPIPNQTYTGFEIKPEISVSASGSKLSENVDFGVTYANNINVGNADVTVKGKGDFRMFASKAKFTIVTKNISAVTVAPIADYPYTGSAVTPEITVTDGIKVLREGTDYTVTYANNINEGSATVTITGKGNYSGTTTTNFQISKEAEEPVEPSFFEKVFSAVISFFARIIAFLVSIFM